MSARDRAEPCPYVTTDGDAAHAVRLPARYRLPALLVAGTDAAPYAVVPPGSPGPPTVEENAGLTRIADLIARTRSPLVGVGEGERGAALDAATRCAQGRPARASAGLRPRPGPRGGAV
ncbi:hypothetical protein [Streptomyces sp. A012304]|uniref:hypothetical protein n=1 Tax=Streptomyces sp. A012304 TaxID=375446 RepID=UPI0022328817|nr:hypothetical protein [Streptomyces sp. A012304]GKQ39000.1 hypothetical protein ALMP_55290 [Streptomyces sp. A012304]